MNYGGAVRAKSESTIVEKNMFKREYRDTIPLEQEIIVSIDS